MDIAITIIAIAAVLLSFVAYFFSARTWKIFHIILLFFTLGGAIAFTAFAAMTLKTHKVWHKAAHDLDLEVATLKTDVKKLKEGNPSPAPAAPLHERFSVVEMQGMLDRLTDTQRAVWSGCTVSENNANIIKVTIPDSEAASRNVDDKMVVQVFQETGSEPDEKFADVYVGEFRITEVNGNEATLESTHPFTARQANAINAAGNDDSITLALYEKMPLDAHDVFVVGELEAPESSGLEGIFCELKNYKLMDRDQLVQVLNNAKLNFSDEDYEKLLLAHLHDGRPLHEIQKDVPSFTATPQQTYVRVRFLQDLAESAVDGDAGGINPQDKTFFDDRGRSDQPGLNIGKAIKFAKGDEVVLSPSMAADLIGQGICQKIEDIFVRSLTDFDKKYRTTRDMIRDTDLQITKRQRETDSLAKSVAETKLQVEYWEGHETKLGQDLLKFKEELAAVSKVEQTLQAEYQAMRAQLSALYNANLAKAAELAALQQKMADYINKQASSTMAKAK